LSAVTRLAGLPTLDDLDLVALDLDGTVLCPQGAAPISERILQAVRGLQAAGLPVTFVTGRTEDYALPIARRLAVETPLVTYNGGRIYSPRERRALYQAAIPPSRVRELLGWLDGLPDVVAVYMDTPQGLRLLQNRPSGCEQKDDYLFGTPRQVVGPFLASWGEGHSLSKAIVVTRRNMEGEVGSIFGKDAQAVRTHADLFEILPGGISKGTGVARLCELLDIDPRRVLAVGDQENDVSTFRSVGFSVAMGDAPDSVKAAAGWTTGAFAEEGCAQVLEALLESAG
jgi:Cof subfamily protein (haloacid dehalogenase superfamily)